MKSVYLGSRKSPSSHPTILENLLLTRRRPRPWKGELGYCVQVPRLGKGYYVQSIENSWPDEGFGTQGPDVGETVPLVTSHVSNWHLMTALQIFRKGKPYDEKTKVTFKFAMYKFLSILPIEMKGYFEKCFAFIEISSQQTWITSKRSRPVSNLENWCDINKYRIRWRCINTRVLPASFWREKHFGITSN